MTAEVLILGDTGATWYYILTEARGKDGERNYEKEKTLNKM